MTHTPTSLEAANERGTLSVAWPDLNATIRLPDLRGACACAQCVDEWTGRQLLDRATIPNDITIRQMELVGNYAVRIRWSDGHESGLFTWEKLRSLAEDAVN